MTRKFTIADKAYYVAQYLEELAETDRLPARTVCEKYQHSMPGYTGLQLSGIRILEWAEEISAALHTPKAQKRT